MTDGWTEEHTNYERDFEDSRVSSMTRNTEDWEG